jgi:hypothetical protein
MSATATILTQSHDIANCQYSVVDFLLDSSYPTGGYGLTSTNFGFAGVGILFVKANAVGGYTPLYDDATQKLLMYRSAGFTPAGTVAAPTFTGDSHVHDMKYIGGITATEAVAIQGGDTLGKNAATDRTIAGSASATKGGVVAVTSTGTNSAPAFTGTAVAAGVLVQVSNGVSLSTVTVRCLGLWFK